MPPAPCASGSTMMAAISCARAASVARKKVFDAFWSDDPARALMHGPTYMGNALACAAANASLDLFERESRLEQVARISERLAEGLEPCRHAPGVVDVRVKGAIGVVEFEREPDRRALQQKLIARGVWARPFGRIVYLTPAFTIGEDDLARLTGAVRDALAVESFPHGEEAAQRPSRTTREP